MTDLYNNTWPGGVSQWSFNGWFITFGGSVNYDMGKYFLANVTQVTPAAG